MCPDAVQRRVNIDLGKNHLVQKKTNDNFKAQQRVRKDKTSQLERQSGKGEQGSFWSNHGTNWRNSKGEVKCGAPCFSTEGNLPEEKKGVGERKCVHSSGPIRNGGGCGGGVKAGVRVNCWLRLARSGWRGYIGTQKLTSTIR